MSLDKRMKLKTLHYLFSKSTELMKMYDSRIRAVIWINRMKQKAQKPVQVTQTSPGDSGPTLFKVNKDSNETPCIKNK